MNRLATPRRLLHATAILIVATWSATAAAQIPDKFTNLKVLPKEISKTDLVATMRGVAGGLGVRCAFCHVGPEDLTGMDFASDSKREKRIARSMLAMVKEINGALIPKAGIENPIQVRCATCHHGVTRPESLVDIMEGKFESGGLDSATTAYLTLKKTYFGSDSYSFKPGTLNEIAEWLANEKEDTDAAIAIMRFSLEQTPDVAYSYNLLGRIEAGAGRNQDAIESLKKAIELNPDDKWSRRVLDRLEAGH